MKKKKIVLFVFLIVGVLSLILTYNKKININKNKPIKEEKLSIMIKEDGAIEYTKSSSKDIPKGNYVLNEEKTHCENNGKIEGYDNIAGTVSFTFIGTDRCFLYFDYYVPPRKAYDAILLDNGNGATTVDEAKAYISEKGTPTFTQVETTNEGMYATEDNQGTSYYFRGAVDNNWVKFAKYINDFIVYRGYYSSTSSLYKDYTSLETCTSASSYNVNCTEVNIAKENTDLYWRIIRINGDGSIRLIYTGTIAPAESEKSVMTGEGTQIGITQFNSSASSPEHVGYKYEVGKQHGQLTDSVIKEMLESWYITTTLNSEIVTNSLISDNTFCNDRTASTSGDAGTYGEMSEWSSSRSFRFFGSLERFNIPSLKCPNELDKYSVSNGTIENPVGLITADEIVLAGGNSNNNSSYYLYTGQKYWSGSPDYFTSYSIGYSYVFIVSSSGDLHYNLVYDMDDTSGIRPSVSLSSEAKLSGDGTWNNPYTVDLS